MKRWNRIANVRIAALGLLAVWLTACSANANEDSKTMLETAPETGSDGSVGTEPQTNPVTGSPSVSSSAEATEAVESPDKDILVASLPERGIFLVGHNEGVTLQVGKNEKDFDWIYETPRQIAPILGVSDYDRDGHEELAVILYIGSGTGYSIQELHMIGIEEGQGDFLIDHMYEPEKYLKQIHEQLSFRMTTQEAERIGEVTLGDSTTEVNFQAYPASEIGTIDEKLTEGNIVRFEVQHNAIQAEFGIGFTSEKAFAPIYLGTLYANILYRGGEFTLDNARFSAEPEYLEGK